MSTADRRDRQVGGEREVVVLLKLGGSLITDKRRPDTARDEVIERLAGEIAAALAARPAGAPALLLGHGSGSFGHAEAVRHGLRGGDETVTPGLGRPHRAGGRPPDDLPAAAGPPSVPAPQPPPLAAGIAATQAKAAELHRRILAALRGAGVPAYSLPPSSWLVTADAVPLSVHAEPIARALAAGLLPVVYGDVVTDRLRGAAICSTETALAALAEALPGFGFRPARALWLGETPGLLTAAGDLLAEVDPADPSPALAAAGAAGGHDVTGGMAHRLTTALALAARGIESHLADGRHPGLIHSFLAGKHIPGTRILARPKRQP